MRASGLQAHPQQFECLHYLGVAHLQGGRHAQALPLLEAAHKLAANDPLVAALGRELGGVIGREYAEQFRKALRDEVGVKRNPAAVRAVRERLVGGGN